MGKAHCREDTAESSTSQCLWSFFVALPQLRHVFHPVCEFMLYMCYSPSNVTDQYRKIGQWVPMLSSLALGLECAAWKPW